MNRIMEKCCEKCNHSSDTACKDFVICRTEGPLCHEHDKVSEKQKQGTTIFIGTGTCGLGAGAGVTKEAIISYLDNNKIKADVVDVGCIGLCSMEPIVDIQIPGKNRVAFGNVLAKDVDNLLTSVFSKSTAPSEKALYQFADGGEEWKGLIDYNSHSFFKDQTRIVLENCGKISPFSIGEYIHKGGYKGLSKALMNYTPSELCDIIEKSGLRGRGGGGFLTGKKWKIALVAQSLQKYFICNADEGDPGAFMDRAVIEGDPHRLLEGLIIAAYAIGATKAYVYIRAEYPLAIKRLVQAIADAKEVGLIGYNVLDSGFNIDIIIKKGAGAFVCGEETALIHSIEGKRGMPRPRPPFPAVSGLFGSSTIINNVETLANIPSIVSKGYEWFASMGTENSKGTKVFALSGDITRTGLVEVKMGITIRKIIEDICGGVSGGKAFKAAQLGGPSGGCVPAQHLDTKVDYESLKQIDAIMGSGGLVVMNENTCMVDVAKFFMDFIQRESCGKCIPCREGTKRMLEILKAITSNKKTKKIDALHRFKGVMSLKGLAEVIKETSLCGLGQTAPNPVLSTIKWFEEEYAEHIFERQCRAKVCKDLFNYYIDKEKCKGCTLCAKKCPAGAIVGEPKATHYVMRSKCIKCGACIVACPFDAITKINLEDK